MQSVSAIFRNGRVELTDEVNWPDGTPVQVSALSPNSPESGITLPLEEWPEGFFDSLRAAWGDEPFDRPPQGEFEDREDW